MVLSAWFYGVAMHTPIGVAVVILFYLTINILFHGRERFEGFPYNVADSSQNGDMLLIGIIVIAMEALQQIGRPPGVVQTRWFQYSWIGLTLTLWVIVTAISWFEGNRGKITVMDRYHQVFIVPLFAFLIIGSLPVLFLETTWTEFGIAWAFAAAYFGTFFWNKRRGRLNQPAAVLPLMIRYLENKG